jgi:hypothetical protein
MRPFAEYILTLRAVVTDALSGSSSDDDARICAALDGQPSRELRRLVPLETRRADGAFFTGSLLAKRVVGDFLKHIPEDAVVCDPACGVGDLLIAATARLAVHPDLRVTLSTWAKMIRGYDIHEHFVEAARLRIVLAAIARGARAKGMSADQLASMLTGIRVCDGLLGPMDEVDVIVMNPPYGIRPAPPTCTWATGLVSDAAVFTDHLLQRARPATKVVAILPDVLRTGTRYHKWRRAIEQRIHVRTVNVIGQFDKWADVDVFTIEGATRTATVNNPLPNRWWTPGVAGARLADHFDVHVGAVVPHRDPKLGPWRKYVHARTISNADRFDVADAPSRRFNRKTFRPPFVAIRRTSRPDDRNRAVGTVIVGDADVAVENHLIVASPRSGNLRDCETLIEVLRSGSTTGWLNERIRCRHLTVGAVADIPWVCDDDEPRPSLRQPSSKP